MENFVIVIGLFLQRKGDDNLILSGHQPNYLPYPGLIGKIMKSDKFIYVSNVQFEKKSWQSRNRIKGANGEIVLTVPVLTKGKFEQKICDVEINNNESWKKKHFNAISLNYKKTPFYREYIDFFDDLYKKEWNKLNELDIYIMNWILQELDVKTEIYYDTEYSFKGTKSELLVDMTKTLECDTYLSNKGSQNYVQIDTFLNNGLNHRYLDYQCEKYDQCFGKFISNLSVIDMLFNLGKQRTKEIIADDNIYVYSKLNQKIE